MTPNRHLDLNLLSPAMQTALYGRVVSSLVERSMITLVILTLVTSVFVVGIEIQLNGNLASIQSRQLLSTEYVSINREIRGLNSAIGSIETAQKEFAPASVLLRDLMERVPDGVHIGNLSFDARTKAIRLSGHADLRQHMLDLEASLLASPYFVSVDSPISNLLQPRDIVFQIGAVADVDALKTAVEPVTQ